VQEFSYALIAILVGVQGYLFLRNPVTRSMRSVLTVVASGLLAFTLGSSDAGRIIGTLLGSAEAGIAVSAVLGGCAAVLPALVSNRWSKVVSSLPPADWDTHWAIWDLRDNLWKARSSEPEFRAVAQQARARLAGMQLPADAWEPVREALLQQIEVTERILAGEVIAREDARAVNARSDANWDAAINARRRFFR
jgi:hypothetical protein